MRSEGNRLPSENCVIGGTAISKAVIQNKKSGKTCFARCFWSVSEQFSRQIYVIRAKKMEPIVGIDEERSDEEPERSDAE